MGNQGRQGRFSNNNNFIFKARETIKIKVLSKTPFNNNNH